MDRACHQLFTRAALAGDENRRAAWRRLDDEVEDLSHPRTLANDVGELVIARLQVLFERDILGDKAPALDGVAQHDQHFVVLEGLGDVVERALFIAEMALSIDA